MFGWQSADDIDWDVTAWNHLAHDEPGVSIRKALQKLTPLRPSPQEIKLWIFHDKKGYFELWKFFRKCYEKEIEVDAICNCLSDNLSWTHSV